MVFGHAAANCYVRPLFASDEPPANTARANAMLPNKLHSTFPAAKNNAVMNSTNVRRRRLVDYLPNSDVL